MTTAKAQFDAIETQLRPNPTRNFFLRNDFRSVHCGPKACADAMNDAMQKIIEGDLRLEARQIAPGREGSI